MNCTTLTSVTIPDSVVELQGFQGYGVFYRCTSLQSVKLSNNLEVIGNYTFNSCSSLQEITIPASVASIEQNAFSGAPLSKVYFENTEGWQHGKQWALGPQ